MDKIKPQFIRPIRSSSVKLRQQPKYFNKQIPQPQNKSYIENSTQELLNIIDQSQIGKNIQTEQNEHEQQQQEVNNQDHKNFLSQLKVQYLEEQKYSSLGYSNFSTIDSKQKKELGVQQKILKKMNGNRSSKHRKVQPLQYKINPDIKRGYEMKTCASKQKSTISLASVKYIDKQQQSQKFNNKNTHNLSFYKVNTSNTNKGLNYSKLNNNNNDSILKPLRSITLTESRHVSPFQRREQSLQRQRNVQSSGNEQNQNNINEQDIMDLDQQDLNQSFQQNQGKNISLLDQSNIKIGKGDIALLPVLRNDSQGNGPGVSYCLNRNQRENIENILVKQHYSQKLKEKLDEQEDKEFIDNSILVSRDSQHFQNYKVLKNNFNKSEFSPTYKAKLLKTYHKQSNSQGPQVVPDLNFKHNNNLVLSEIKEVKKKKKKKGTKSKNKHCKNCLNVNQDCNFCLNEQIKHIDVYNEYRPQSVQKQDFLKTYNDWKDRIDSQLSYAKDYKSRRENHQYYEQLDIQNMGKQVYKDKYIHI